MYEVNQYQVVVISFMWGGGLLNARVRVQPLGLMRNEEMWLAGACPGKGCGQGSFHAYIYLFHFKVAKGEGSPSAQVLIFKGPSHKIK